MRLVSFLQDGSISGALIRLSVAYIPLAWERNTLCVQLSSAHALKCHCEPSSDVIAPNSVFQPSTSSSSYSPSLVFNFLCLPSILRVGITISKGRESRGNLSSAGTDDSVTLDEYVPTFLKFNVSWYCIHVKLKCYSPNSKAPAFSLFLYTWILLPLPIQGWPWSLDYLSLYTEHLILRTFMMDSCYFLQTHLAAPLPHCFSRRIVGC